MEKKLTVWSVLCASALLLTTAACSDDNYSGATDTGGLRIDLDVDPGAVSSAPQNAPQSRATLAEIGAALSADDFTIRLTDESGQSQEWPFSQFDGSKVKIGTYTVTAFSGQEGEEGFDKAYFEASQQVTVVTDRTSSVALTATLANAAVGVTYTEAFRNYMASFTAELRTAGSENTHIYPADASGELFINAGEAALYVSFTTQNGQSATLKAAEFTAAPRHAYNITVDVNGGEIGDGVLTVTFDDSTTAETREFELSEELFNAPAPEITPAVTSLDMIQGLLPEGVSQVAMNVVARGKLDEVTLTTTNNTLIAKGWPAEIDLMKATPEQQALLKQLGLKAMGLWMNPDRMAVIDLTEVVKSLDSDAGFRLEVVDRYGKVSDPAGVVSVTVTPVSAEITGQDMFMVGANSATLTLEYNGAPLTPADVKAEYLTDRGASIWDEATVKSVTPTTTARSIAATTYAVVVEGLPGGDQPLQVRLTINGLTVPYTLERGVPEFALAATDNATFATHAVVTVSSDEANAATLASQLTWQASTDGTTFKAVSAKVDGAKVTVSGLTPGTTNYIKGSIKNKEKQTTVTTEAAAQLPNSGMEDWTRTDGKTKYWWIDYPTGWATLNELTTSVGDGNVKISSHKGTSYCAFSGTSKFRNSYADKSPADGEVHSGTYCAYIATVGWGDNSAIGTTAANACKNLTPGELYLGSYDSASKSAVYSGMAFGSRPSAFSFFYKYTAKNSADWATASIQILDASGNILAEGSKQLAASGNYQLVTIPFTYAPDASKASLIKVQFKSSGNSDCWSINNDNLSSPPGANLSDGRFTGSELWIDDLSLTY